MLAATDYVAAAIEVIDSRIQQRQIGIIEFVADNASSARFALGRKRVRPADVDLTDLDGRSDVVGSREHVDGGAVMSRKSRAEDECHRDLNAWTTQ
ncbi:hypothetical protein A9W96_28050 [Mycobacterium sp. 1245852.3]|nr:hypothetical protein A9W96_28050 [Mycobacterium sp. 1245852.3]